VTIQVDRKIHQSGARRYRHSEVQVHGNLLRIPLFAHAMNKGKGRTSYVILLASPSDIRRLIERVVGHCRSVSDSYPF